MNNVKIVPIESENMPENKMNEIKASLRLMENEFKIVKSSERKLIMVHKSPKSGLIASFLAL